MIVASCLSLQEAPAHAKAAEVLQQQFPAPAVPQYAGVAPYQQQYGAPQAAMAGAPVQYSAHTGTGGSYGSAAPPGVPPPPMHAHPQAQEQGYGHAPPLPQGPSGNQPPPLPPAGATAYGQPPY